MVADENFGRDDQPRVHRDTEESEVADVIDEFVASVWERRCSSVRGVLRWECLEYVHVVAKLCSAHPADVLVRTTADDARLLETEEQ